MPRSCLWQLDACKQHHGIMELDLIFIKVRQYKASMIFWQMMPHFIKPWYIIHSPLVILLLVIVSSHLNQSCDHFCKFVLVFFSALRSNYPFLQIKTKLDLSINKFLEDHQKILRRCKIWIPLSITTAPFCNIREMIRC